MMSYLKSEPTNRVVHAPWAHFPERDGRMAGAKVGAPAGHRTAEMGTRSRRFPWLSALSPLLWPATAAAWNGKVVLVDRVTVERYGRTVAFVKVGDAVVDEKPVGQGLARVFNRYCDRAICEQWEHLEDEARAGRRGLWSMRNAIPAWEFRKSSR